MHTIEDYLRLFYNSMEQNPVLIPKSGMLAGWHSNIENMDGWMDVFAYDNMHYPMGDAFLTYGISGIILKIESTCYENETDKKYMDSVLLVYKEIRNFILQHALKANLLAKKEEDKQRFLQIAKTCDNLTKYPPSNFLEAMQLFWFMYVIRSPFGGGCIGRLDQILYPFYQLEEKNGTLNKDNILTIIMTFYNQCNQIRTGDTLRNLMLSGQDATGKDQTNELTYLFLEAYEKTGDAEPHLNVRLHQNSPSKLKELCVKIIGTGKGQPTFYFDENIIPFMENAEIPKEMAYNYANDGCTETVINGKSSIFFLQHEMVKTVELTLFNGKENPCIRPVKMKKSGRNAPIMIPKTGLLLGFESGDVSDMNSFDEVYEAFERQLDKQLERWITIINDKIEVDEKTQITSPFIAGTLSMCLENGKDPLRGGGFEVANYQLLSGSIGTAADCLRGIQVAVFEKKWFTMEELLQALEKDFVTFEWMRQRLLNITKYGNGELEVESIAEKIGNFFIQKINSYRSESGKRIWPGLYNIDFKIFANITGATPDGRRFCDPIGEHCSPTPGAAKKGPTAVIESASKLPMQEGYASSPLHITLDKTGFIMGAKKEYIINQLIDTSHHKGIPVLNISMYSKEELIDAKKNPSLHQDLIVRVWGFNAKFVELDDELQDHLISRIVK